MVHESHVIVINKEAGVRECLRCFACVCHYDYYLQRPCVAFEMSKRKKELSNAAKR